MDFGQLFNTLLNSLPNQVWYFVPLFILLPILRTPWFKGKAGEAEQTSSKERTQFSFIIHDYHR